MKKILIIEDEQDIAEGIKQALELENYIAEIALNGDEGVKLTATNTYDLVICDIMMPQLNGFEVISEIRYKSSSLPIIIISARIESKDKIRALNLGADDYVTKPFDISELIARVNRKLLPLKSKEIAFDKWRFNTLTKQLINTSDNSYLDLPSKDQELLELLLLNANQIVSRDEIIKTVWGPGYDGTDRTVDNAVVRLRKVLGNNIIKTIRSQGYRLIIKQ